MMGGSGGAFGGRVDSKELLRRLRESQDETEGRKFETKVASEIDKLLKASTRDMEAVNTHLEEIKKALSSDIDGVINFVFGGSVAKHTFVDGLSDIDAIVILNKTELKDKLPKDVLGYFLDQLRGRFPKSVIDKGELAVTVRFKDIEIQVLPAVKSKTGLKIADATGKGWNFIKPREFQKAITKANEQSGGKVVPTIKLVKSIISCFSKDRQLTGYHTESLAVNIFQSYKGEYKPKNMLKHFFHEASKQVLSQIPDVTGQSKHLDSYLGKPRSEKRRMVADSLASVARRMENADLACSLKRWREILGGL